MKKLYCCRRAQKKGASMEKLDAQIEMNRVAAQKRQERTQKNIETLREDLYQGIMKPFFYAG